MLSLTEQRTEQSDTPRWRNWSGDVQCQPRQRLAPATEAEIQALVQSCRTQGRTLRVVGSGHSFTPLVATDDLLLSLDNLQGLVVVNRDRQEVTVWAGTKLRMLGRLLFELGYAQENLGDIDAQSIAGAISTGTHGSGLQFGSLSTQVTGLRLITGTGELIDCSEDINPELFQAARLSLGCLGIITQVTLKVLPAYKLHYRSRRVTLQQCLQDLPEHLSRHRNFEFYWFPYSDRVQLKFMDQSDAPNRGGGILKLANDLVLENAAYSLLCRLARRFPALCPSVSRLSARLVSESERIGDACSLYATHRLVRFHEMEYSIPLPHFQAAIKEIRALTAQQNFAVHFPLECRFVKADDIPLSPAFGRDSAFIAVHMYQGMPYEDYFRQVETILLGFEGRPHWGKWHSCTAATLTPRYPGWHEFHRLRAQLDPDGLFMTPYLRAILK